MNNIQNKKRVYMVLDSQRRELDSRLLFISKCLSKNYEVTLSSKANLLRNFNKLKTGIVIIKGFGPKQFDIVERGLKFGFKFLGWDEEAILFNDPIQITDDKIRIDKRTLEKCNYYFSWGDNATRALKEAYPQYREKFITTGNPRIDVLKNKYKDLYKANSEKIKLKYGKYILFTTKFSRVNNIFEVSWMDTMKKRSLIDSKEKKEHQFRTAKLQEETFPLFLKLIKRTAKEFNDYSILIRPHPSEKKSIYFELEKEFKNIAVCDDHISTNNYILGSEILISSNCTTLLESFILNKPSINYLPVKDEEYEYFVTSSLSKILRNEEEVLNTLKKKNFGKLQDEIKENLDLSKIQDFYVNFESEESCDKIIDYIGKIEPNKILKKDKYQNIVFYLLLLLKKKISDFSGRFSDKDATKIAKSKRGNYDDQFIYEKFKILARIENLNKFKIKKIFPGVRLFNN